MSLSPEDQREQLRRKEMERNSIGNLEDSSQNAYTGNFLSSMSNKALGIFIVVLVIAAFIGWLILN
ncbi:DUF6366 family protein [Macrococcus epidermidis]|uniref:DUF6366 family protein n=1 Tax=Macrococcus epidermidis TaxID=1902580 RepID=UPI001EF1EE4F|nr:DUF6366 family protein [Macrococcus epidermidis]MCG7421018.1 DUF6366 family protein [Macrococcus epidermidis]